MSEIKRRTRRFSTVEEIEREIDRVKSDALFADTEADKANARAYAMMKGEIKPGEGDDSPRALLDKRDKLRKKSKSLMTATLDRLKERIGVMRTVAPPDLIGDASIPRSVK